MTKKASEDAVIRAALDNTRHPTHPDYRSSRLISQATQRLNEVSCEAALRFVRKSLEDSLKIGKESLLCVITNKELGYPSSVIECVRERLKTFVFSIPTAVLMLPVERASYRSAQDPFKELVTVFDSLT